MNQKIKTVAAGAGIIAVLKTGIQKLTVKRQTAAAGRGGHIPYGPYEAVFKRPLDAALSAAALLTLSPVMALVAALVRWKLGKQVLFRQQRPGLDEKIFTICKFRTMSALRGSGGILLSDDQRLTDFGKGLRALSLDELPELWNILKGEMSFVGPRPLLTAYLPRYSKKQRRRHDVKPGLTGLAQVSGRNSISWEEKFEKDLEYVERITFAGDMKILLRTVHRVLAKEGIHSPSSATADEFMGNDEREVR